MKTMSPSACWAKSVIPTVAAHTASTRTHSCVGVYSRSRGSSLIAAKAWCAISEEYKSRRDIRCAVKTDLPHFVGRTQERVAPGAELRQKLIYQEAGHFMLKVEARIENLARYQLTTVLQPVEPIQFLLGLHWKQLLES